MKGAWTSTWVLLLIILTSGCRMDVLDSAGGVAEEQSHLIVFSLAVMMIVLVTVFILFAKFIWTYREHSKADRSDHTLRNDNKKLEITWTILPVIVLGVLAVPMLMQTYDLETKADRDAFRVNVTGHQYWWQFDYPDQNIRTSQELHLPANEDVVIELKSSDVIHSFWIPQLGGKKDAIPGETNELYLETGDPGVYDGKCAELCGAAHTDMRFQVVVEEEEDFEAWSEAVGQDITPEKTEPEEEGAVDEGERVFQENCLACHAVDGADKDNDRGPNLALYGEQEKISGMMANNKENVKAWLRDPESFKPSTEMPAYDNLTEEEMDALVDYLHSIKGNKVEEGRD
ncbi:cytochrome c oxidase subunit II [Alteribacillus sp. YIM 98480]|uniref:cytochrome c oxidase subunit II n=1 Tax=Alteribacillus sp. YIM 98480 TaxID=2606599 RepID=UPI00131A77E0|nr:cytochrome c oxidase subunit II [Alteribacillus sp. YIM 98480]